MTRTDRILFWLVAVLVAAVLGLLVTVGSQLWAQATTPFATGSRHAPNLDAGALGRAVLFPSWGFGSSRATVLSHRASDTAAAATPAQAAGIETISAVRFLISSFPHWASEIAVARWVGVHTRTGGQSRGKPPLQALQGGIGA